MGLNHPLEATIHLAPSHSALCLSFSICRRQKSQERFCWRLQVTLREVGCAESLAHQGWAVTGAGVLIHS